MRDHESDRQEDHAEPPDPSIGRQGGTVEYDYTHWQLTISGLVIGGVSGMLVWMAVVRPIEQRGVQLRVLLSGLVGLVGGIGVFTYGVRQILLSLDDTNE